MGFNKIIKNLQDILDTKKSRQLKRIEAVETLVLKLEKKQEHFKRKLEKTENDKDIKKLVRKIKVGEAQLKKGQKALKSLHKVAD